MTKKRQINESKNSSLLSLTDGREEFYSLKTELLPADNGRFFLAERAGALGNLKIASAEKLFPVAEGLSQLFSKTPVEHVHGVKNNGSQFFRIDLAVAQD